MRIGFVLIGNSQKLNTLSKIAERKLAKDGHTVKYFSMENAEKISTMKMLTDSNIVNMKIPILFSEKTG